MNERPIFLDETFLFAVWPNALGFLCQNIVTVIVFIIVWMVWGLGSIPTVLIDIFLSNVGLFVFMIILFGSLAVIIFVFTFIARRNPLLVPIRPISKLGQIKTHQTEIDRKEDNYFKFLLPMVTISVGVLFFIPSFLSRLEWQGATFTTLSAILPFHIGFLTVYFVSMILEILLLLFRYIIHRKQRKR